MGTSQDDELVKTFFIRFQAAIASLDLLAIGSLYADTFLFGGPAGSQAVRKQDFLDLLPKMKARFESMGLSGRQLQRFEIRPIGPKFLLANTTWKMSVATAAGCKVLDASATYVLERREAATFCIVLQIDHQDLAEEIRQC